MLSLLSRKPRLLLLDDDPSMQRLIMAMLSREGYRIDVVSSGSQAIENVERHKYNALLLDVMTPTDGGVTVIRYLREASPALLKRIVLVTASPPSVLNAVENEVFAIIRKPFEPKDLVATVARAVKP
jgi:CheY-like chemotaxis protein